MHTFKKEERLTSKKAIDRLFSESKGFYLDPFSVIWSTEPFDTAYPARILISVPRKKIRKAVQRNFIKRRIREAYRLQKKSFYEFLVNNKSYCSFALIYNSREIKEYKVLEEKILLVLQRLQKEYEKGNQ